MEKFVKIGAYVFCVFATLGMMVSFRWCEAKDIAVSLAELLGSLLGIVIGAYFIQRLVNKEASQKETSRWLIQKIDDFEKSACECQILPKEECSQRMILSSKILINQ